MGTPTKGDERQELLREIQKMGAPTTHYELVPTEALKKAVMSANKRANENMASLEKASNMLDRVQGNATRGKPEQKPEPKEEQGSNDVQTRLADLEEKLGSISMGTKTKPENAEPVQRGPQRLTRNMADPGVNAGEWLRKAIMDPRAELSTGGDGAGLVPEPVAQQIWYALMGRLSIVEAGADVIRLPNGSFKVPAESTASTAYWLAENSEITDAGTVFGDSGLEPHAVKALLSVSNEALQDTPEWAEQAVFRSLSDALVRAMNKAFLVGSGSSNEPEGIFTSTDVTETDLSSTDLSIDHVIAAYYDVLAQGGRAENMVMILNPSAAEWMEKIRTDTGSGEYLASSAGPLFRGMRWVVASDAPYTSGTPDTSDLIIADIGQAVQIVEFGGMRMQVDPSAGFAYDKTMFRTVSRMDVAIRYPSLIHKLSSAQVSS